VAPFWSGSDGPPSLWLGRGGGTVTEVEVAVVGGGVVGLSAAYWLARMGRRPLLLEAGHLAGRASGRNAGFLLTGSPEPYSSFERRLGPEAARAFWELSRESRELLRAELLDSGRVECRFRDEGSWLAVVGGADDYEAAEAELRASGERLAALGFELEWHEGAAVERASGSPRIRAALHQPRDGGLDPVLLCRGIAEAGGFPVRTGAWVHRLEPRGGRIEIVADGGSVLAERVVVALNAYAPALLPWLAREIRPVRGQMLATGPGERSIRGVWYLNHGFEYVRQADDGAVVAGGGRRALRRSEIGYLEHPTASVQGALERFLHETYPAFAERPIERRWAGVMAFTEDGLPRFGEAPGLPGVVYAAGFNGHGLSLGFATGRWLARRVLGETAEPLLPPARPGAPPSPLLSWSAW
jgi:glycine/D-amino acid oxidase-like deaminating enzyme